MVKTKPIANVSNVTGMSRHSGQTLDQDGHVLQSLRDILTTPIGSRVMRRDYGSLLPFLIDSPMNTYFVMQMRAAVIHAIMRWETRVTPISIHLLLGTDAPEGVATLLVEYRFVISKKVARTYLSLGGSL